MNHFKRFRSTLKLITDNNNGTPDVLSNLKADTEHTVGVLLIMDDGNFNNQDIVFGKYMTSCVREYFRYTSSRMGEKSKFSFFFQLS